MSAQRYSGLRLRTALLMLFLPICSAMPRQLAEPESIPRKRTHRVQLGSPNHIELFEMYDIDSDGFLKPTELLLLLQRPDHVNAVDEFVHRLKTVFTTSETNGDGKLDLAEFTKAVSGPSRAPTQIEASGTFELFDENGDQLLNYNEVANAIQRMTGLAPSSVLIEQMFARADSNGNGAIDQAEFTGTMKVQEPSDIHI